LEEREYLFDDDETLRLLAEVLEKNASIIRLETRYTELKNQKSLKMLSKAMHASNQSVLVNYGQWDVSDVAFQRALLRTQLRCVQRVEANWELFSHQHSHFNKPMDNPTWIYTELSTTCECVGEVGSAIDAMNRCARLTSGLSGGKELLASKRFTVRLDSLWEKYEKMSRKKKKNKKTKKNKKRGDSQSLKQ